MSEEQVQVDDKKPGFDPVDLSGVEDDDLRGQIQARINNLYGQVKTGEKVTAQMAQDHKRLVTKVENLETAHESERHQAEVDSLKQQKVEAMDAGDHERVVDIDERLTELKAPKAPPQEPPRAEPREETGLSSEQARAVEAWAAETDEQGNLKRPWTQTNHPRQQAGAAAVLSAIQDPSNGGDMNKALQAADRAMGVTAPEKKAAPVLKSGDGIRPEAKKRTELSNEQKMVARKMGLSEEAYAKALAD